MGGAAAIAAVMANNSDFGNVCPGSFRDLPLTINNNGTCTLQVNDVLSSSPEFRTSQVLSYPLAVAPGTSLQIPIRFQPTTSGSKFSNLTLMSNDPTESAKLVPVVGNTPSEFICKLESFP